MLLTSTELPMSALNTLVSEAIDVVVHSTRTRSGVRVTEIVALEELTSGPDSTHFTVTSLFSRPAGDGPLEWTGHLPVRLARGLRDAGYDVRMLLDDGRLPT